MQSLSEFAPECDHELTLEGLMSEWPSVAVPQRRKRDLLIILESFEAAKEVMSDRAIHELCEFLKTDRWFSNAPNASGHRCYKYFRGRSTKYPGEPQLYYPYFFVVQALFPESESVKRMYRDMSLLWEVELDPREPFYPRLEDAELEFSLIIGNKPQDQTQTNARIRNPLIKQDPHAFPISPSVADSQANIQQHDNQKAAITDDVSHPESPSNNNFLNNYNKELEHIRSDFERRLSEFQSRLHKDTTGARSQELAVQSQELAAKSQEHAKTASQLADALIKSLNAATNRPGIIVPDDGDRPSKRARQS
ncbi:hypothetical protein F53441_6312 [Fusarium austroafricanum]|uniref:Uncharacterized protein n=1 Tax=Fusarium austroafricanum TaxID=2364996 RepID=A0A8H4KI87_9HYPO|nr:hypothetical protein F53441_6312 [Fusarium austroafricanum]